MKSIDQRSFAWLAPPKGTRGCAARFFRPLVRTIKFSCR